MPIVPPQHTEDLLPAVRNLCRAVVLLTTEKQAYDFLKDACTPAELTALAERWHICQCLHQGLSYRQVQHVTGASLVTIGRVARFLRTEPHQGYAALLRKWDHSASMGHQSDSQGVDRSEEVTCKKNPHLSPGEVS